MNHEAILKRIIDTSTERDICMPALDGIKSNKLLLKIALENRFGKVQQRALYRITDDTSLLPVIYKSDYPHLVDLAFQKIKSTSLLVEIATLQDSFGASVKAAELLSDEKSLKEVFENSSNFQVRYLASKKINDPEYERLHPELVEIRDNIGKNGDNMVSEARERKCFGCMKYFYSEEPDNFCTNECKIEYRKGLT